MSNLISKPDKDAGYLEAGHKKRFNVMCPVKDRIKMKAAFEHKTDHTEKKKPERDSDGKVMLGPKNVKTGQIYSAGEDFTQFENPAQVQSNII